MRQLRDTTTSRAGLTDKQRKSPRCESLMGQYFALRRQTSDLKAKAEALLAWAEQTEATATLEDRNRLTSEAQALGIELGNLSATIHQLPAQINILHTMSSR